MSSLSLRLLSYPTYDPALVAYETALTLAMLNGQQGYYVGGVFRPVVVVGGVQGYYDPGGRFHTSVSNRTTIVNNYNTEVQRAKTVQQSSKPNYFGSQQSQQQKPNYGAQQGTIGRGQPTASTPAPQASKPNYVSGNGGTISRGTPSTSAPSPSFSKPSYGSSSGSMTRSASPSSSSSFSKPSYSSSSSSSGSMGRRR